MPSKSKKAWDLPEAAATSEEAFASRRRFIKALGIGTVAGAGLVAAGRHFGKARIDPTEPIHDFSINNSFAGANRKVTWEDTVYRFNNFYEFSLSKTAVVNKCRDFKLDPWSVSIEGLVKKPRKFDLDDLLKLNVEQRVYRFRCVEAWAMTVPWLGVPLRTLLEKVEPQDDAKYLFIESFFDPDQVPRQRQNNFPWPYKEAITIEEAMNPLALAAIGMYGNHLQPQNGAPMRIVLPWKYGFKGPKSVVRITLTRNRPSTFWNTLQPQEYGFYGNVNPDLPHPRWSQASEVLIGQWGKRVSTEIYNGYQRWVGELYIGDEY